MNLETFLDRVVAPGNWLAICYKSPNWPTIIQRFFPRDEPDRAARRLRWFSSKSSDTYFAMASFNEAEPHPNNPRNYRGKRTKENADRVKTFWADADIKRPNDNKDPSLVFVDDMEVIAWVKGFCAATGLLLPNIWIKSGYGVHLYWSFEDALDTDTWKGYAEALKTAIVAHGFKGDAKVTSNAVCILRPPETVNYKDPSAAAHVYELYPNRLTQDDYPNDTLLPLIEALPGYQQTTSFTLGTTSGSGRRVKTGGLAAARAGVSAAPRDFSVIASNCAQVRQSLDVGGDGDQRNLWLAWITLATFCENGRGWAHTMSQGDPRYTQAETDKEYTQVEVDRGIKHFGPPLCATINIERPGVCQGCPHFSNPTITTPFHVGLVTVTGDGNDLPYHWQRSNGWIEREVDDGKTKTWRRCLEGDITEPVLDYIDGIYRLTMVYTPPNNPPRPLCIDNAELNIRTAKTILCSRGMHCSDDQAPHICRLLMSWIEKLQRECRVRSHPMPSFGWYRDAGNYLGFSTGGVCYLAGGGEADAPGADRILISRYSPIGDLTKWQDAAAYIAADCPELHTIIAVAFGAPLMRLQGGSAAILSFVAKSGSGKSAATHAGQSVWADPVAATFSVDDTENYKGKATAEIRSLPVYWDEAKVDDELKKFVAHIHKFTQGRDKGRLTQDTSVRESGDWATIYAISTNDSIRDLVASVSGDIDATVLRVLEVRINRKPLLYDPQADGIVSSLRDNRGVAGAVYARHIADNVASIQQRMEAIKTWLNTKLVPNNDERFYVAVATACIMGAKLAKDLGLIDLDVKGVMRVLMDAIQTSREVRSELAPANFEDRLVGQLDQFLTAYGHERVVTDVMRSPGAGSRPRIHIMPIAQPKEGLGIAYHIAAEDKIIRINSKVWRAYWNLKRLSPTELQSQMTSRWGVPYGATRGLGFGTAHQAAKAYVFSLDLAHPDLSYILEPWEATSGSARTASKIVPIR